MQLNNRGFTLIEMLVVVALLAIIMIGLLNLLDTSTKISVVETELADTQENVRFTAYHLLRTARMVGSSAIPIAANVGGTNRWLAARLRSNVADNFTEYGTQYHVAPGSDVLTLYGMFEIPVFFTDPLKQITFRYELAAKGVTFTMAPEKQPWGGFMAMFADPDGNVFYLDEVAAGQHD